MGKKLVVGLGTVVGAVAGVVAGVLVAPKSGKQTRGDIKKTASELKKKASKVGSKKNEQKKGAKSK